MTQWLNTESRLFRPSCQMHDNVIQILTQCNTWVCQSTVDHLFQFVVQSALFACVPDPQDVDGQVGQLVAHFVVSDDDATHLARQVLVQWSAAFGAFK